MHSSVHQDFSNHVAAKVFQGVERTGRVLYNIEFATGLIDARRRNHLSRVMDENGG